MRYLFTSFLLLIIISLSSCRKDFTTSASNGNLSFSQDTIFFNRVFDNISSSTHHFTVKNTSDKDITVPFIGLERGNNSFYRLNIDGASGKTFEDVTILAKDSIFIFSEATIDFNQVNSPDFMYRDKIVFDSGENEQKVELEALVLDVNLIRPNRTQVENGFDYEEIILGQDAEGNDIGIRGTNLTENTTWSNNKPYLIYNYVGVPNGTTLTIDAGTKLHFHQNSGIIVQNGGTLIVNGAPSTTEDLENQVLFQGDRLEEDYAEISGQWGAIWLMQGSINSVINHTTIKNATIGLLVDSDNTTQTLQLNNSQIYNTTSFGILARNAKITAKNMVISNNGDSSFSIANGGNYQFYHSTIANYWNNSSRQNTTLSLSDSYDIQGGYISANLHAYFTNCIIYGNQNLEFSLENLDTSFAFEVQFKNCLMKFNDTTNEFENEPLYDFANSSMYQNILFNKAPNFLNTNTSEEPIHLIIGDDSFANNQADTSVLSDIVLQKDILGVDRTISASDIGAYQHITFEEN